MLSNFGQGPWRGALLPKLLVERGVDAFGDLATVVSLCFQRPLHRRVWQLLEVEQLLHYVFILHVSICIQNWFPG